MAALSVCRAERHHPSRPMNEGEGALVWHAAERIHQHNAGRPSRRVVRVWIRATQDGKVAQSTPGEEPWR